MTLLHPSPNKSADLNKVTISSGPDQSAYFNFESQSLKELLLLALATMYFSIVLFFMSRIFIFPDCKVSLKTSQKVKFLKIILLRITPARICGISEGGHKNIRLTRERC
jgi:hypothetical protein